MSYKKSYYQNKVALVTGGAGGIGRALCEKLGHYGAQVIVSDIHGDQARCVAELIRSSGGEAVPVHLDVSDKMQVQKTIDDIVRNYGQLDLMFNNAGISVTGEVHDMDLNQWRQIIDVNLFGVIYGAHAAYQTMLKQGSGQIVNISSLEGLIPLSLTVAYATSKFAVVGFSTSFRPEAAHHNIKVNVVCPGFINTGILETQPFLNVAREDMLKKAPKKGMCPLRCAETILNGVRRNREIITAPFTSRLLWWVYRFVPVLIPLFNRNLVKYFHAIRMNPDVPI